MGRKNKKVKGQSEKRANPIEAGQKFIIIPTSAKGYRCLLHTMAINLIARARYGTPTEQEWLNSPRLGVLFDAIGRAASSVIPQEANKQRQFNFNQLAHLDFTMQQEIVGTALKELFVNLLAADLGKEDEKEKQNAVIVEHLSNELTHDFSQWCRDGKSRAEYFAGMDFVPRKFKEIQKTNGTPGDKIIRLKEWWAASDGGYLEYVRTLGNTDAFLGQEAVGVLCRLFNINFHHISQGSDHFQRAVEDHAGPTLTAYYNGQNHWEAVLPKDIADKLSRAHRGMKRGRSIAITGPIDESMSKLAEKVQLEKPEWLGMNSGSGYVVCKVADPKTQTPAVRVKIKFTINPNDKSMSLYSEPSEHLDVCFEKFAQLYLEKMKQDNAGAVVMDITLNNIRPPDKQRICIKAFENAGFKVHFKGDPNRLRAENPSRNDSAAAPVGNNLQGEQQQLLAPR